MEMSEELLSYLTPEEREAWEVSQKATKGPWEAQEMTHYGEPGTGFTQAVRIGDKWEDDFSGLLWEDGQFIAAARNGYPNALVALAEMRRKAKDAEEKLLERTTQRNLAREARENWRKRAEAAEAKVQEVEGKMQWVSANLCEKHLNLVTCSSGPCGYCEAEAVERKVADLERDGWVSVEERLPKLSGDDICIRLTDGSELHSAILQSDGYYWWHERFFDPKLVTHWRPKAEAEAGAQEQGGGR